MHRDQDLMANFDNNRVVNARLRERSTGDLHDFAGFAPAIGQGPVHDEEILALLECLVARGVLTRSEQVHPYDSSEYRVEYRRA